MKVVIFWGGFQGSKHAAYWKKRGAEVLVVTRSGAGESITLSEFWKNYSIEQFHIVILAVSPIEEQEGLIRRILLDTYAGYLIIEKPVAGDWGLLQEVAKREKTVFFVDEAFIWIEKTPSSRVDLHITVEHPVDLRNMYEHAMGMWLFQDMPPAIFSEIQGSFSVGDSIGYTWGDPIGVKFYRGMLETNDGSIPLSFDRVCDAMVLSLRNETMLARSRENFCLVREIFSHHPPVCK